jgi:DNA-binding MarR family transcriptional regulator
MAEDDELHQVQQFLVVVGRMGELLHDSIAHVLPEGLAGNAAVATLMRLAADGSMRPGQIMDFTNLTSSGVSRLLDRLEDAGLVARSYGSVNSDRRGTLVKITKDGRRTCRAVARNVSQVMDEVQVLVKELAAFESTG